MFHFTDGESQSAPVKASLPWDHDNRVRLNAEGHRIMEWNDGELMLPCFELILMVS